MRLNELEPATQALFNDRRVALKIMPTGSENILLNWEGAVEDAEIFTLIFRLIDRTQEQTDAEFREKTIPLIEELLKQSSLFSRLEDPEIILTDAHRAGGKNSKQHIFDGLRNLRCSFLPPKLRKIMRIFVLMHDTGKSISSGLTADEARAILEPYGETKNSFPQHQLVSALILQSIIAHIENYIESMDLDIDFSSIISPAELERLVYLISNHHIFPKLVSGKVKIEDLAGFTTAEQHCNLLLLGLFNHTDISATMAHRPFWANNKKWLDLQAAMFILSEKAEEQTISLEFAWLPQAWLTTMGGLPDRLS